jgi:hypothetical protein
MAVVAAADFTAAAAAADFTGAAVVFMAAEVVVPTAVADTGNP